MKKSKFLFKTLNLFLLFTSLILLSSCKYLVKRDKVNVKEVLETTNNYEIAKTSDDKIILKPSGNTITTKDWYTYYQKFSALFKAGDLSFLDYLRFIPDSNTNPAFIDIYPELLQKWAKTDLWKNAFAQFSLLEEFRDDIKKEDNETWSDVYLRWTRSNGNSFYIIGSSPYLVSNFTSESDLENLTYYKRTGDKEQIKNENLEAITKAYAEMQKLKELPLVKSGNELLVWSDKDDAFIFNGIELIRLIEDYLPETPAFISGKSQMIDKYDNFFTSDKTPPQDINVFYKTFIELFDQGRYSDLETLFQKENNSFKKVKFNEQKIASATKAISTINIPRLTNFPGDTKDFQLRTIMPVELASKWYTIPYLAYGLYPENMQSGASLDKEYTFMTMIEDYLNKLSYRQDKIINEINFNNFNID